MPNVEQFLSTKLYIPASRSKLVNRPRLIQQLNEGLHRAPGVTLISAPAGFGKTTLLSKWISQKDESGRMNDESSKILHYPSSFSLGPSKVAWLSLDEGDSDPTRFLAYLIAALQMIVVNIGEELLSSLQTPQPPSAEWILTVLLNEISTIPDPFVLILDDYHAIDSKPVDKALTFLLDRLPPHMHLVIATREDPDLPLARYRVQGYLTELRAADLRFTPSEAAEFLNQIMALNLTAEDIAALETRTEGWIAGMQLAALSMQGQADTTRFIQSFTGSHRFVMDYLVEEVLHRQPERVQTFLIRTSILDRLCGSLCDAVLLDGSASGQHTLEYLERANLFIVPLDNDRRWYRYHHLFADLLRQRLRQSFTSPAETAESRLSELHIRASQWYEDNGLYLEAFQHAAAAQDIERAERLMEGEGIPRYFRGAVTTILDWLASLPKEVLNARPWLWWRYGSLLLISGQSTGVKEKLDAAEAALALKDTEIDDKARNLIGQIASARAVLALTGYHSETMITQSRRALEYLGPDSFTSRATAKWTLGYAHIFSGNRAAAQAPLSEAITLGQKSGDIFTIILATIGLANIQEGENQLNLAAETYRRILQMAGDQPLQIIGEVHLGLARILYEWNELDAAEEHGQKSLQLERQYDRMIDRFIICEVFLARLKLAQGDVTGAAAILAKADQSARQNNFIYRMPEIAAAQVLTSLRRGNLMAAAHLSQMHQLPISQARVHLALGKPSAALRLLESWRQQAEAKDWKDERLRAIVLQALAQQAQDEKEKTLQLIGEVLEMAEPGGFIRLFVDEGPAMAQLLSEARDRGVKPDYIGKLLAAFEGDLQKNVGKSHLPIGQSPIEPLSPRELEVLQLIAQGLSNNEIGKRLFLALDTVKGHNRRIYDKLHVQRRTEAVARARELGLL